MELVPREGYPIMCIDGLRMKCMLEIMRSQQHKDLSFVSAARTQASVDG
jgi:hypothetical protein